MNIENKRVLERFNTYVEFNGVSMAFVSKKLGLNTNNVYKWRADKMQYGKETLSRITEYLDSKER
ncbi:hypothetical protein MRP26_01595 [Bacillus sp. CCB-MMP212]|uniref:hypothetical protein n=1 Tax=Bacillus sp. CCB-MMP212 TaxID=2928002 RepID=UPI001F6004B4|nr:hypothetical protein [Bacillus sp. CCB-MMP212]MCI4247653.1 hypothetical protein [Bacillus sp. CCB-MMP212]